MMNLPAAARPEVDRIGPGDVLQITIFEVGARAFLRAQQRRRDRLWPVGGIDSALGGRRESAAHFRGARWFDHPALYWPGRSRFPLTHRTGGADRARLKGKSQDAQVIVTIRENVLEHHYGNG